MMSILMRRLSTSYVMYGMGGKWEKREKVRVNAVWMRGVL